MLIITLNGQVVQIVNSRKEFVEFMTEVYSGHPLLNPVSATGDAIMFLEDAGYAVDLSQMGNLHIKTIIDRFPQYTGAEILAEEKFREEVTQIHHAVENADAISYMEEVKQAPKYYTGQFGLNQKYFYRVFNAEFHGSGGMSGLSVDYDKIVCFFPKPNDGSVNIEVRLNQYQNYEKLGLCYDHVQETSKEAYDEAYAAIVALENFWK